MIGMRNLFGADLHMGTWRASALASLAILGGAAMLHFTSSAVTRPAADRALDALAFSGITFVAAIVCGVVFWGVARLINVNGNARTLDMKETVLWVAALVGTVCTAVAVLL